MNLPGLIEALELVHKQTEQFDCPRKKAAGRVIQAALIERIKQCDTKREYEYLYVF